MDKHVFLWPNCSRFQAVRKILSGAAFPPALRARRRAGGPTEARCTRRHLAARDPLWDKKHPRGLRGSPGRCPWYRRQQPGCVRVSRFLCGLPGNIAQGGQGAGLPGDQGLCRKQEQRVPAWGAPPELIVVIAPPLPHVPLSTTCKASLSTWPCPARGSSWGSATSLLFLQFALTKTKVGRFLCCCPALPCPGPAEVKPAGAQPVFLLSSPGAEHPQTHL